ncbi:hypothetical protein EKO04_011504 [Ascochyta lentis]|uniref:Methyltransferase domain-containing protein n=1 Tax=Ascochyta lentis TaxID=205686 RepID=A0A8H7MCN6_9PLEO|nr:hypothetical protein EKO04_011504 [Ascochyta lentis]
MVQETDGRHSGAGGGVAGVTNASNEMQTTSTQNTQYDQIGTKYLEIKQLPAVEPEVPSILAALGEGGVKGKKCLGMLDFTTFSQNIRTLLEVFSSIALSDQPEMRVSLINASVNIQYDVFFTPMWHNISTSSSSHLPSNNPIQPPTNPPPPPPDLACGTGKYTHLLSTLGATSATGHDISPTMIASALTLYPASQFPTLHFSTHDCSIPSSLPVQATGSYDLVFSAWFLNYAGSEQELTNMFRVVDAQMRKGGRFVALTTDVHDVDMSVSKLGFYGLDVLVLEPRYVAPDTGVEVGIKARVKVGGGQVAGGFEFDVFQFRREVYERCALRAGLRIGWRGVVVPDDERRGTGYWDEWLRRPTFAMLEATRVGEEGGG